MWSRTRAKLFSGFLSHSFIRDRYGRPGTGDDKGAVEGPAGFARRNFMVPMPGFVTRDALNLWLAEQCRKRQADALLGHGRAARFENRAPGSRKLRAWLPQTGCIARVVYVATGSCHAALERRFGAELSLIRVNPLQARRFAQSTGPRAKTDAVDARLHSSRWGRR